MTLGVITSILKSRAAGKKSRTLCVTMAEARPFTAASSTISSAGSAAHNVPTRQIAFFAPTGVKIPVAVSAYPDELYTAPQSWTEQAYPKLIHYNRMAKGGHFAAWERPQSFTEELRASFRSLR